MTLTNTRIVLTRRPTGLPRVEDFAQQTVALADLNVDEVRLQVEHISIDAFIRTTLNEAGFHATSGLGAPVTALGVGKVLESRFAGLKVGDYVAGPTLAQTIAQLPGALYQKIDVALAAPSVYLGILGMTTGLTAYMGMLKVAAVKAGDTVVVSGAAGAVGTVAVQIAKIQGATVIGIAGGPEKSAYLVNQIGADAAIDYKNEDVPARLTLLAPNGIDVFFDNVGGELLDWVLDRLATGGRIAICGAISQYSNLQDVRGPNLYLRLAERNATMGGFTVDHYADQFGVACADLVSWMNDGRLILPEHVLNGIENFSQALVTLFTGGHMGKLLVNP